MRPDRAAMLFRELLQTPYEELGMYAQRAGIQSRPEQEPLAHARELLEVINDALEAGRKQDWDRVNAAWKGQRQAHGVPVSDPHLDVAPPAWVRPEMPKKPELGDAAPGTAGWEQQKARQERFVPPAQPAQTPAPAQPVQEPPAEQGRFVPSAAAAAPGAGGAAGPAARRPPPPPRRGGQTAASPPATAPAAAAPTPPPEPGDQSSVHNSVAKYAAFCAGCAAYPEQVDYYFAQYGVADAGARAALDEYWQDRFDDEPALQTEWEELFARFRSSLRR